MDSNFMYNIKLKGIYNIVSFIIYLIILYTIFIRCCAIFEFYSLFLYFDSFIHELKVLTVRKVTACFLFSNRIKI